MIKKLTKSKTLKLFSSPLAIVFLLFLYSPSSEKQMSTHEKNIQDFKKAAEYIHRNQK